jgi:hypothetical protein
VRQSRGSKVNPALPTTSGRLEELLVITGAPHAIASTGDLTAPTTHYRTWTEASAALWQIRNTSPAQARELQIVTL